MRFEVNNKSISLEAEEDMQAIQNGAFRGVRLQTAKPINFEDEPYQTALLVKEANKL